MTHRCATVTGSYIGPNKSKDRGHVSPFCIVEKVKHQWSVGLACQKLMLLYVGSLCTVVMMTYIIPDTCMTTECIHYEEQQLLFGEL